MQKAAVAGLGVALMFSLVVGCSDDDSSDKPAKKRDRTEKTTTTGVSTSSRTYDTSAPATPAPATTEAGGEGEGTGTSVAPTTAASSPTTAATAATATTSGAAPEAGTGGENALAFFRSTEARCKAYADEAGGSVLESQRFAGAKATRPRGGDAWMITDGMGDTLVVDLKIQKVFSVDGPQGVLPLPYSYGCPPDLYLGSSHD